MKYEEFKLNLYEEEIKSIIIVFYEAYYNNDRLKIYSLLDTRFQREVPLNYFLIHEGYYVDLGTLIQINRIHIQREKRITVAEVTLEIRGIRKEVVLTLHSDFGGWKLDGEAIINREFGR